MPRFEWCLHNRATGIMLYYPRNFGISVGFKRASGDYDWHEIKFNNDSRDCQYLSNKVVANSD
jgi:hypothetical protein